MKRVFSLSVSIFMVASFSVMAQAPAANKAAIDAFTKGAEAFKKKDFPNAIINYNKAIELDAKMATAYIGRGIVANNQNKYPEALADFTKAITLDPKLADAYSNRGIYSLK
jgi:tetratricopeptide (TPR) repeat protein